MYADQTVALATAQFALLGTVALGVGRHTVTVSNWRARNATKEAPAVVADAVQLLPVRAYFQDVGSTGKGWPGRLSSCGFNIKLLLREPGGGGDSVCMAAALAQGSSRRDC